MKWIYFGEAEADLEWLMYRRLGGVIPLIMVGATGCCCCCKVAIGCDDGWRTYWWGGRGGTAVVYCIFWAGCWLVTPWGVINDCGWMLEEKIVDEWEADRRCDLRNCSAADVLLAVVVDSDNVGVVSCGCFCWLLTASDESELDRELKSSSNPNVACDVFCCCCCCCGGGRSCCGGDENADDEFDESWWWWLANACCCCCCTGGFIETF